MCQLRIKSICPRRYQIEATRCFDTLDGLTAPPEMAELEASVRKMSQDTKLAAKLFAEALTELDADKIILGFEHIAIQLSPTERCKLY